MDYNLADLFESIADRLPDRLALVCAPARLSFAQLEERANRLAHGLASRGVQPGDHVALYLMNCAEYIEAMLACFKIRAVPVNVNFRYVEEELRYLLDDADAVAVLHQRAFAPRLAAVQSGLAKLRTTIAVAEEGDSGPAPPGSIDYEELLAGSSPERGFAPRSPDDLYIIYTGGTTGMPKGVMWRQEDLFFSGLMGANPAGPPPERPEQVADRAAEREPQRMMSGAPLIHGAAQLGSWIAMLQGFTACLVPRFEPHTVWRTVQDEAVLTLSIVGDAMARPLAEALDEAGTDYRLDSLAVMSSAGAVWSPAVKAQLRAHFPNLLMIDAFGASETGSQGTNPTGERSGDGGLKFTMNEGTVVLDEERRAIPPGAGRIGVLALRGRVPLGYYKDPEKTARTFVEIDGVRHVLIGDMARPEADGTISVFGRGSQCINSGGEKIYPEEVEGALKSHPDVFDAVVVGVPDSRWGETVAALVQLRPGRSVQADEVAAHTRKHVAGYKAPRVLHFVDEIRRSPSGKPDYPWAVKIANERADDRRSKG